MAFLLLFSFLAGLATILAPCVWPILPVVLSSSAGAGHKRPLGISLGIIISFAVFTLSVSYIVKIFHLDPNIFRLFAVIVIGFLGLSMIIPSLSNLTESLVSRLSGIWGNRGQVQGNGFLSGFITGVSLGIVWSPCAGPILASIAALAATGQVSANIVFITFAYSIGAGLPLLAFAYGGQWFFKKTRIISPYTGVIQKIFGIIMILTALAIFTNYDKVISAKLLEIFPAFSIVSNNFENNESVTNELGKLKIVGLQPSSLLSAQKSAPDFAGITKWLNTDKPLTIADLKGKVVLVDFWTYTCINCIRTLPFVTSWYNKYKDQGFVVIGVHTPEFEFEKNTTNVENAIKQYKINYPVAQDNNYETWQNYGNKYWPAEYLIDIHGNIRRTHFGEGEYDKTEMTIQSLLKEAGNKMDTKITQLKDETPKNVISPESYLSSNRAEFFYPGGNLENGKKTYTLETSIPQNSFSLGGSWEINNEYTLSGVPTSTLEYNFNAQKVFIILRPPANKPSASVKVLLDGKIIDPEFAGDDVKDGLVSVNSDKLYNLVNLKGKVENHILHLQFDTPGTMVYVFTFG